MGFGRGIHLDLRHGIGLRLCGIVHLLLRCFGRHRLLLLARLLRVPLRCRLELGARSMRRVLAEPSAIPTMKAAPDRSRESGALIKQTEKSSD